MIRSGIHLARPSKKAVLVFGILFLTMISAYTLGSTFRQRGGIQAKTQFILSTPGFEDVSEEEAAAVAAKTAADAARTSDSAKSAASGLSGWSWVFSVWPETGEESPGELVEAFTERMVVFTARIEVRVDDIDPTVDDIMLITEKYGGFISAITTRSEGGSITVRVPQKKFYEVVSEIEGLGEVVNRDLKGEDVTENYVDLQAQLSNLQKQEGRFVEILSMCATVEDVLKVESELKRIRGEIEGITGKIKYLENRVELATITVLLSKSVGELVMGLPQVDWWAPVNSGLQALFTIIQGLLAIVIVLGPFVAVGLPVYYLYKRLNLKKEAK